MLLNKLQYRSLKFYVDHRTTVPAGWTIAKHYLKIIPLAAILLFVAWFAGEDLDNHWLFPVSVGIFFGAFLREWRNFRNIQAVWPLLMAIIDWDRATTLLAAETAARQESTSTASG